LAKDKAKRAAKKEKDKKTKTEAIEKAKERLR